MGTLYVVATPIGNLEDITLRAIRVLKGVDVVLAEDTRVAAKLLSHFEVDTKVERLDAQVEGKKGSVVIEYLKNGDAALVSDAGTPVISDPGSRIIAEVREAGFHVVAVPGPSALTVALSIAGIPADTFTFLGFPPHKKGRQTFFEEVSNTNDTVVFYESPHRILKALDALGGARVIIARELTKMYEEILDGTASELKDLLERTPEKQKGEFVVIVPKNL